MRFRRNSLTFRIGVLGVAAGSAVSLSTLTSANAGTAPPAAVPLAEATTAHHDVERCNFNAPKCMGIGFTDSWFNGTTVNLQYSHRFFCASPPASAAPSNCEAGAPAKVRPSGGVVVSPIYVIVPIGFTPDGLQCPRVGDCIDHPARMDLSRVFGPKARNVLASPHSHIIVDREKALSSWWPAIIVGVSNPQAWQAIAHGKSYAALQRVRHNHPKWVTPNIPSNLFLYFQVLQGGDDDSVTRTGP